MKAIFPFFCYLLLSFSTLPLFAQDTTYTADTLLPSLFNEFYTGTDEIIELTITTNMRQWIKKKHLEEYQKAELSYTNKKGEAVNKTIKLKTRGNIRKQICFYPPLKFKFKKAELADQGLIAEFNDFKMVNQCKVGKEAVNYIFREYMAYKLYNILSPYSFRVQLITINYIDSEGKNKPLTLHGLIIESEEELAERLGGVIIDRSRFTTNQLQRDPYLKMAVFQYFIGNTDWSVGNLHNMKLLKVPEFKRVLAVPYDFDYCGLVDAHYAVPHESLNISTVRTRLYRGRSASEEEAKTLAKHFADSEAEVLQYCEQFPHFTPRSKKEIIGYLEEFFADISRTKYWSRVLKEY